MELAQFDFVIQFIFLYLKKKHFHYGVAKLRPLTIEGNYRMNIFSCRFNVIT